MSKYLSRDEILRIQDFRTVEVDVPEWNGTVRVRELNALEVEEIGFGVTTGSGEIDLTKAKGLMARLVSWGVVDEGGNNVFTVDDVNELSRKSYNVIQKIATRIMQISGMSGGEEAGKNA